MLDNTDYTALLLEQIRDQNQAVLEAVGGLRTKVDNLPARDEFEEAKQNIMVIKAAVIDGSEELHRLDRRVAQLESSQRI